MRECLLVVLLTVLVAESAWAQGRPAARDARLPEGTIVQKDIECARIGERSLKLDLYRPAGDAPRPLVIWIHGGAWRSGSRANPPALFLLEHGYAVASIEYRFSQHAKFPAQILDCKSALRFLRANSAKLGIDPERIAVAGASAGGHLAALLGTSIGLEAFNPDGDKTSDRVSAVIDLFGPSDLIAMTTQPSRMDHGGGNSPEGALVGGPVLEHAELAKLASPVTHVDRSDPPFLIIHGDADPTVPHEQSKLLHAALRKEGVESELVLLPGAGHGGPAFFEAVQREKIVRFLDKHLAAPAR
jgi:acetyl esterase/lipase